jgi:4-hydroxy-3-methylbut-2-enyl diphosphate reductase
VVRRVVLASPRGFCAGVVRAIATVERALTLFGPPVYVRRAIVHNARVVRRLAEAGAIFVDELDEVPRGATAILSAHGAPAAVRHQADLRDIWLVDATCPLVSKVHREVRRFVDGGLDVVLIGHAGHDEVIGTLGQAEGMQLVERAADVESVRVRDPRRVACVTQTTLNREDVAPVMDAMRRRFPTMDEPAASDICYATRNRQAATSVLARIVDVVLVVGDESSSNSQRLREVAMAAGTPAHLVDGVSAIRDAWVAGAETVGVSAGASTPEDVVAEVVRHLCRDGAIPEEVAAVDEHVSFRLPPEVVAAGWRSVSRRPPLACGLELIRRESRGASSPSGRSPRAWRAAR